MNDKGNVWALVRLSENKNKKPAQSGQSFNRDSFNGEAVFKLDLET